MGRAVAAWIKHLQLGSMRQATIIKLPNLLAARIGPRAAVFTVQLLRKAENALEQIRKMFGAWLVGDVAKLDKAIMAREANPDLVDESVVKGAVRQILGSADAFGFPIVVRLASSLLSLYDAGASDRAPPMTMVRAHVDAIKVAAREQRRDEGDPISVATCTELEALAAAYLKG